MEEAFELFVENGNLCRVGDSQRLQRGPDMARSWRETTSRANA
jgi:hypothetical protein